MEMFRILTYQCQDPVVILYCSFAGYSHLQAAGEGN